MPKSIYSVDTGDPSYLGAYFLFMKNRTFPCPSPSANLVGIRGNQEDMSNILLLLFFGICCTREAGGKHILNIHILQSTKLFYDFSHVAKITGMNPAARCVVHALLMRDNSTCKFQCTSFLKLGSH